MLPLNQMEPNNTKNTKLDVKKVLWSDSDFFSNLREKWRSKYFENVHLAILELLDHVRVSEKKA